MNFFKNEKKQDNFNESNEAIQIIKKYELLLK